LQPAEREDSTLDEDSPTSPANVRQIKPRDDAKLLAELCELKFRQEKGYLKIIEILKDRGITGIKNEPEVSKLIKEAQKRGVITFDINETFALRGDELQSERRDLRELFDLKDALVIKVPEYVEGAGQMRVYQTTDNQPAMRKDDHLHIVLANHAGVRLGDELQSEDHCAVAGGRAVNQAVRMIKRNPPSRRNIMVTSMGGRLWSHQWWRNGPSSMRPLDPDDSAFLLFLALENETGTMFDQVGHRVFAASRKQAVAVMSEHCMFQPGGTWYDGKQPNRAIVGVGAVDPESCYRGLRDSDGPKLVHDLVGRHLEMVKPQLDEAIDTVKGAGLYFGDLANRYFPTLPMPHEINRAPSEYDSIYERLIKQLNRLNDRMVVVEWAHIRQIPSVTAIAGGSFKLHALWTILFAGQKSDTRRLIDTLVTDATTASRLMSAMDSYKSLDPELRRWYDERASTFFIDPAAAP
jgi:DNA-binding transcriptional regulator LsrR (DeoR family)